MDRRVVPVGAHTNVGIIQKAVPGMKLVPSAVGLLSGYFKHLLLWELSANSRHRKAICWMNLTNETITESMNP